MLRDLKSQRCHLKGDTKPQGLMLIFKRLFLYTNNMTLHGNAVEASL